LTAGRPPKTSSGLSSGAAVVIASDLVNSVRRSSSGVPIVRSLVFMIATRSHSRSASSSRWVGPIGQADRGQRLEDPRLPPRQPV
jgi:hypothetical protein